MKLRHTLHAALVLAVFALTVATAQAHEFILKPATATPAAGQKTALQAQASHATLHKIVFAYKWCRVIWNFSIQIA